MSWCKLTLMIFVMTEGLPEERRVTHTEERGRRDVFQVLMLHHSGCIIRPRVVTAGCHGRVATQCTEDTRTCEVITSLSKTPWVHPGDPCPTLVPCSGQSVQCWQVNPAAIYPLVSRNQLVHFISSVCFNLPRNVIFAPGNLLMWRWQPNTLWHDVSSITRMATKIAHVSNISFPKLNAVYNF